MALNVQFLMSGRQFAKTAAAAPPPATTLTQSQRVADFFAKTSKAAAAAKCFRLLRQEANRNLTVNVGFLRSGAAFLSSAMNSDQHQATDTSSGFSQTRAQRLEAFYKATQATATFTPPAVRRATVVSPPPTMVNLQFLTSGKEFEALAAPPSSTAGAKMSRHARLEAFYKATQATATFTPPAVRRATVASPPPTMVNLQFLTSGKEFEALAAPPSSTAGAKMSRHARLEAFYKATQATATFTPPAVRRATVVSPPLTMVNLQFLRSGKEFFSVVRQDRSVEKAKKSAAKAQWKNPGPTVSRHARQLAFFKSTQAAVAAVKAKQTIVRTPLIHTPPISSLQETIVNLKFLRSGKEFTSKEAKQLKRSSARPSGFPDFGPKKSRAQRLQEFYTRSAPAPATVAAVNAPAGGGGGKGIATSG